MNDWKQWIGKDVKVILHDGNTKFGVLQGPVIMYDTEAIPAEFRLMNGIFVTRIQTEDIAEIQDVFE